MSWISDVKDELHELEVSIKRLRQFSFLMSAVLFIFSIWLFFKNEITLWLYATGSLSFTFLFFGIIKPKLLSSVYRIWMAIAFAMGWIVSRFILILIFFLVITPIGILGRIFGKKWMDKNFDKNLETYWITKSHDKPNDYEKMY